jgi:hypothetical protein
LRRNKVSRIFETVIRVPMPDGALAWGKVAASIEPAFEALAKGLAKAGVEGVEIVQREVTKRAARQSAIQAIEDTPAAPPATHQAPWEDTSDE